VSQEGLTKLDHVADHAHNQETHANCLADAEEFAAVGYTRTHRKCQSCANELGKSCVGGSEGGPVPGRGSRDHE